MGFFFRSEFFFGQHELEFFFFCGTKCKIFFQNLTLWQKLWIGLFFFLHQNQNIFFSNIGNQNIFLGKNHNPPFKLNGRSPTSFMGQTSPLSEMMSICKWFSPLNLSQAKLINMEVKMKLPVYITRWAILTQVRSGLYEFMAIINSSLFLSAIYLVAFLDRN